MFCGVEKIALTFWRRVFRVLNDSLHFSPFDIHPFLAYQGEEFAHVMTLADVSTNERQSYIRNFERFMFTRDPYERLFSAYIDKLYFPNGNYWQSLGGYIVKLYRKPFNPPYKVCGHNVTFKELAQFVIDNQKSLYYRDNHLIPIYEHCRPCDMNYTFVGRLENFRNDANFILHKIGAERISNVIQNNRSAVIFDLFVQDVYFLFYFRSEVSTCMNFYQSLQRFWNVMRIRGLIDNNIYMPFTEETSISLTQEDLLRALLEASRNISKIKSRHYRKQIMKEAYMTLTTSMRNELRTIFQPDCDIFGYDCTPEYIFS
ncbi:hypothetical protein FSP39_012175 [Pinctada imbricata]|uniref:Carbohydrate sulfotransferase n=1 Tax=Pinctada imbricata TaxID=66713 RepID=A0AA88YSK0_PINIB|nr:hypothetical protein FSP39_012175 [Pinctada imbricata]